MHRIAIWKNVEYRGKRWPYKINQFGEILSDHTGTILRPWKRGQRKGVYLAVGLCKNGKRVRVDIHRLTALHFVYNPNKNIKKEVNHIDENAFNAAAGNLDWVTRSENELYKNAPALNYERFCFIKDRDKYIKELEQYGDVVPF